ncbi:MAG: aldo/keto reductase [Pseudomonadota bacterium]|nr:aldo/keto reductase [Pseudomonadota bacterium]
MQTVKAGGAEIPVLGFGTWQLDGRTAQRMVEAALGLGYRHIDTAFVYENEREVGAGIRASGVPREEVFLTTKVWTDSFREGDLQRAAQGSVDRLGVGPVDLLLLHWPAPQPPLAETMRALNDARSRGLTRNIGLSNFPSPLMEEAQRLSEAPIVTNQMEYHPFLTLKRLLETARRLGSSITAWSPLAQGKITEDRTIRAVAEAHGKTPGQVTLRWLVQQDVIAIPRTSKESRAKENFDIWDFELSPEEMARISALGRPDGRIGDWLDPAFRWDPE